MKAVKKRPYNRVDVTKLSPKELVAYKKRLAGVRRYTRDQREYLKRVRSGKLDPKIPLAQFRGATRGSQKAAIDQQHVKAPQTSTSNIIQDKINRLLAEIERAEVKKKLVDQLLAIA